MLRSPHYTELVCDGAGIYLYSKIDCFHIVLPVDEKSVSYFNTFQNGLYTNEFTKDTVLLQCTRPKQRGPHEKPFSEYELTTHFPGVLEQWNVQLHHRYISMMLTQPSICPIKDYDIPFIIFPGEECNFSNSDLKNRMTKTIELAQLAKATIDIKDAREFDISQQNCTEATKHAANISPLRVVMLSKADYEQIVALKAELCTCRKELELSKSDVEILGSKLESTLEQNEELQ